ncbi:MAG: hypothetical protein SAL07_23960 [Oscillatoria sp. PMC 1051.18]|nr:hypothetical protein [Oscillatoria sp. PMC 1050.18]MEC5032968.1 hypothetical protein [Oscillatoria sp. PMC 1051.18]
MYPKRQLTPRQIPILLLTIVPLFVAEIATAQTISPAVSCEIPLQTELLRENQVISDGYVVTASTTTPTGLTRPSLWWAKEQFDTFNGKLINNWLAYPNERRIDLIVNRQYWTFYNYLDRYRFINQFGTVARNYGYNLRIFNQQGDCLATYGCDFTANPTQCNLDLDPIDDDGFQLSPQS